MTCNGDMNLSKSTVKGTDELPFVPTAEDLRLERERVRSQTHIQPIPGRDPVNYVLR